MKVNLVFEGGGILGITFLGAYKALNEHGHEINSCAGTSAGSIISSLIMAGYSADELIEIMSKTEFKLFMDKTKLSKVFLLGKPLSLLFSKGIYKSNIIETWMDELLSKKGIKTFNDLMINGESRLKIIAADITRRKMLILPDDIIEYGIKPEDFSVAKAVAMSCTIPFFFIPYKLKYDNKISYIVDGGLISSFPIWVYDVKNKPRIPTLGFKIKDPISLTGKGRKDIIAYISDLIEASILKEEISYVRDKDLVWIINLENNNTIKSTDFKLNKMNINYLFENGYNSTVKFLNDWSYAKTKIVYKKIS